MTASVIQVGRGPEGVEGRLLRGDAQTSVAGQATPHASCGNKERRSPLKALELGLPQVFHLCPHCGGYCPYFPLTDTWDLP